ncbi:MAG: DNA repair protein RecN [Peptococcales bacterium]|jgi:DNA repair protein RecN (Recombination protein N)
MLVQLCINGLALIDKLNMEFDNRFNVLTGETGAGKSIIIDAVSLLLGARAQSDIIRAKTDKARVEGVFLLPANHPVENTLELYGLNLEEEQTLILTREISLNGKNTCRVNNRLVTLTVFKEIGKQLVNIYGQHDFQSLSQSENHILLLDSLGKDDFQKLLLTVEEKYLSWKNIQKQLEDLLNTTNEKAKRIDFLKFQIDEITSLNLVENEDSDIESELSVLNNWEKISTIVNEGYELLYAQNSAYDKLSKAHLKLSEIVRWDNSFTEACSNLETAVYYVEDAARALKSYGDNFNLDSNRKEYLQERKFAIDNLKKKYGKTIGEILTYKNKAENELNELIQSDNLIEELQNKVQNYKQSFEKMAQKLSKERKKIAIQLETNMKKQLAELAMPNTIFKVQIDPTLENSRGIDKVEFLISPNPGEPLKPLARIASGGEMSRIMLAFKVIIASSESLTTLIFDEIDTGIGGQVVIKVAEKLSQVSQYYQVLCVTHSPHIASFAHQHFKIFKIVKDGMTYTQIEILEEEEKVNELARMLGGNEEITITHAKEMISKSKML